MKVFEWFFTNFTLAFVLTLITTIGSGGLIAAHFADPSVSFNNLVFLTALPLVFAIVVMLLDNHLQTVIRFVTDGQVDERHPILRHLFFGRKAFTWEMDRVFFALIAASGLVVYPIWLSVEFPILMPYIAGVAGILGIYFGLLYLARFTYRLSQRLTNHINDPNAHKHKN